MFGLSSYSKEYLNSYMKEYRKKNKEYQKEYQKKYRAESTRYKKNKLCKRCRCQNESGKICCDACRLLIKSDGGKKLTTKKLKEYRESNNFCIRCGGEKDNNFKNCLSCRKNMAKWQLERKKDNIQYKLATALRSRLCAAIKMECKRGSAIRDLGCSIEELKIYLEGLFSDGMSWENHGNGKYHWHIDHIYPLSKLNLTDREQFLKGCHYTNLQPMWKIDNLRKANKVK